MSDTFLTRDEIKELTGRTYARLQIETLRKMGLPFFVNAIGRPIVARSVVEGRVGESAVSAKKQWELDVSKIR